MGWTRNGIVRALGAVVVVGLMLQAVPAGANVRSQALYARGLIPFNAGQWEQAYHLFDQAVEADPTDAVAVYYRGLTQARRGALPQATQDLEQALTLNPSLPHVALDLGVAYFNSGRYPEAKTWLTRAHQQPTELYTAAFFLGLTEYRLGDYANAQLHLEEAKSDPDLRGPAAYYAGLALSRRGNRAAARAEFGQAARAQPSMPIGQAAQRYMATGEVREPPAATAPEPRKTWSLYGQLGFEYDTNVVAGPSDSPVQSPDISRKGDGRAVVGLGGAYKLLDTDLASLQASYDFYQSVHFSLTAFDLQGHRVRVGGASKSGPVRFGGNVTYDFYALDYQSFFQEILGTPWVAFAEGPDAATQLYYTVRGRDFLRKPFDPGRDGINHAVGMRQYLGLGGSERQLEFGYQFDAEDTISSGPMGRDFQYKGHQADVGVTFPVLPQTKAQLAYMFRLEDYQFPNSRTNFKLRRHDAAHQFMAGAVHNLTEHVALSLDVIGIINNSNIRDFDYDRYIVSAGVRVSF